MSNENELLGKHLDNINKRKKASEVFRRTKPEHKIADLEKIIENKDQEALAYALKCAGSGGNEFDALVFMLISRAAKESSDNYYRLRMGFPDYVEMWERLEDSAWQANHNTDKFFSFYRNK